MSEDTKPQGDPAVEAELKGVPEDMIDRDEAGAGDSLGDALAQLRGDLEAAKQDVLYAKAETQNVRRRLEKDIADARAYAATGFARDILSVADNLSRALEAIPAELRETVFQRFARLDTARRRRTTGGGFGLGLAIAKRIVAGYGGDIRLLRSDDGATFEIELPALS